MSGLDKVFVGFNGGSERRFFSNIGNTMLSYKRYGYRALVSTYALPTRVTGWVDSWKKGTRNGLKQLLGDLQKQIQRQKRPLKEFVAFFTSHGTKNGCAQLPVGCWKYKDLVKQYAKISTRQRAYIVTHCHGGQMAFYAMKLSATLFVSSASAELTAESVTVSTSYASATYSFTRRFYASARTIKRAGGDEDKNGKISYWERYQYAKWDWIVRKSFPVFINYGYADRGLWASAGKVTPPFGKTVVTVKTIAQLKKERKAADKGRVALVLYSDGSAKAKTHELLMKKLASASGGHVKFIVAKLDQKTRWVLKNDGIKFPSMMLVTGLRRHMVQNVQKPLSEIGYLARLSAPLLANALWDPSYSVRARAAKHFKSNWPEAVTALTRALTRPGRWTRGEPNPRKLAAGLLGRIGKRAVPAIIRALRHKNPKIRRYAVDAAYAIRDKRLVFPLISLGEDPDMAVRVKASIALQKYKNMKIDPVLSMARTRLIIALKHMWNDKSKTAVAKKAIACLADENDEMAIPLLRWIFKKSRVRENRIYALAALASYRKPRVSVSYFKRVLDAAISQGWSKSMKETLAKGVVKLAANGNIPRGANGNAMVEKACLEASTFDTTMKLFSVLLKRGDLAGARRIMKEADSSNWNKYYKEGMARAVLKYAKGRTFPFTSDANALINQAAFTSTTVGTSLSLFEMQVSRGALVSAGKIIEKADSEGWGSDAYEGIAKVVHKYAATRAIYKSAAAIDLIEKAAVLARTPDTTVQLFGDLLDRDAISNARTILSKADTHDWSKEYKEGLAKAVHKYVSKRSFQKSAAKIKLIEKAAILARSVVTTVDLFITLLRLNAAASVEKILSLAKTSNWDKAYKEGLAKALIARIKSVSLTALKEAYGLVKNNALLAAPIGKEILLRQKP